MLYSHNLLKQFIQIDDSIENIGNQITLKACELEEIKKRTLADTVVIGAVIETKKHPNADKLTICQVDCGKKGTYQICTAAENVAAGYYVPVALPGTYLPQIDITIGTREMRGEESAGMICAKEELAIMEDLELHGIRNMQPTDGSTNKSSGGKSGSNINYDCADITDQDLGRPLADKYPRLENNIIDVENKTITNRPDLTGHFGLANEIHTIYATHQANKVLNTQKLDEYKASLQKTESTTETLVKSETEDLRVYSATQLKNVSIKKSSLKTRLTLLDLGLQPRNNRVDFSNLFMLITGQPVHFFDTQKIKGKIIIRNAKEGEEFTDLFDKKHTLKSGDILITDEEKILALAGIIGGKNSGITEQTQNITVEIANFDPIVSRRTAIRLGLRTDAIMRYEKNISPRYTLCMPAVFEKIAKEYSHDLGDFEKGESQTYFDGKNYSTAVTINQNKITERIFGEQKEYFEKITQKVLTLLGFKIENEQISIPLRRGTEDLTIAEDIEEEIARIYGYEKIEKKSISKAITAQADSPIVAKIGEIENTLKEQHDCDVVELYPRAHISMLDLFHVDQNKLPSMLNSIAPETANLANSTLYQLLQQCIKNSKFFDQLRLASINGIREKSNSNQVFNRLYGLTNQTSNHTESKQAGILLYQKKKTSRESDLFLDAKNITQSLTNGKPNYELTTDQHFHPKKQATISLYDQPIGFIGELHPLILESCKLETNAQVVFLSIDIPGLLFAETKATQQKSNYETLQDQILYRDLSFVLDKSQSFGPLINAIQKGGQIDALNIFDIYQGKQLPDNKKSIALQIKIKGDGSMTTEQINAIMEQTIAQAEKTSAILRKNFEQ